MQMRSATFTGRGNGDFYRCLHERVQAYFTQQKKTKKANAAMIAKLVFCLMLFFGLYGLLLSNKFSGTSMLVFTLCFGMASAMVGLNIAHDAVHGALFASSRLNRIFSHSFELIGMSSYVWHLKHNVIHHAFPNTRQVDFDIEAGPVLRLSPEDKLRPLHRFQHLYAPFVYMAFSLSLIFFGDIKVVFLTNRKSIDGRPHPLRAIVFLVFTKLLYLFFMLALPMWRLSLPWWQVLLGFALMHAVLSLVLAFVLIPAHLFEHTCFPARDSSNCLQTHWADHQLSTTLDYASNSRLANFLFGGFNLNVVHHLFPRICHIHLIPVSRIVKQTAREWGVPHHETTLWKAIVSHFRILRQLGRQQEVSAPYTTTALV